MLRWLKKIPYIESLRAFLEQWGLWQYFSVIGSALIALSIGLWSWLESHLPYWAITVVAIVVFLLLVVAVERIHSLVFRQLSRQIDIPKQAKWIEGIAKDMRQTLSDLRAHARPIVRQQGEVETDFHMREHMERMENQRRIAAAFYQKHGGHLIAAFRIIETVSEGEVPFMTKSSLSYEPISAVAYIDAAAHFMESGNIDELKKMDNTFMFHLGGH